MCPAIKRIYTPKKLFGDVVEALTELARGARVGDGADEDTDLGPINNAPQYARVKELSAEALNEGGKGHHRWQSARRARVLLRADDPDRHQRGNADRRRGTVRPGPAGDGYDSIDDAIAAANHSMYGLSGSVWSADPGRGAVVAATWKWGTTWVNCPGSTVTWLSHPRSRSVATSGAAPALRTATGGVHSFTEPHWYRTVQEPAIYR